MRHVNAHTHRVQPAGTLAVMNLDRGSSSVPAEGLWSVGIHPWFIDEQSVDEEIMRIRSWLSLPRVVAVGECGLDRLSRVPMTLQTTVFLKQLELAKEFRKPVIIHNVKAGSDLLQIRKSMNCEKPWLIHGFHGSQREAELFIQQGCYLGFGKMLLNPRSRAVKTCEATPLQWILTETDDATIELHAILQSIAQIKKVPVEEIASALEQNFNTLFGSDLNHS